jgi:hypothetical protein
MTTLTLAQNTLNIDTTEWYEPYFGYNEMYLGILGDMTNLYNSGEFTSAPTVDLNKYTKKYSSPTYSDTMGDYTLAGDATYTYSTGALETIKSIQINFNTITLDNFGGDVNVQHKFSYKYTASTLVESGNYTYKKISYTAPDGTGMEWQGTINEKWTYNYNTASYLNYKYSSLTKSFKSFDENGNYVLYKGSIKYNVATDSFSGVFKSIDAIFDGIKIKVKNVNLDWEDTFDNVDYGIPSFADNLDTILSGNDKITISSVDAPELDYINGYLGNDTIYGTSAEDSINGDYGFTDVANYYFFGGNDKIYGYAGNDYLDGGYSNDTIYGGSGDDSIYGGWGKNKLYGEAGNDSITIEGIGDNAYGGSGNDVFGILIVEDNPNISSALSLNAKISDFVDGEDSVYLRCYSFSQDSEIEISAINFTAGYGISSYSSDANIYYLYDEKTGRLYFDEDANGALSGQLLATIKSKPELTYDNDSGYLV